MSWVENIKGYLGTIPSGGIMQQMYGVPIVKYGPPPSPTPYVPGYTGPATGSPGLDWGSITVPSWQPPPFSMPDISHWGLSFPKLMAAIVFMAYLSLTALAVCGLALRGSAWYLKNRK